MGTLIRRETEAGPLLTYEEYMAEPESMQRADVVDGRRIITNTSFRFQRLVGNVFV